MFWLVDSVSKTGDTILQLEKVLQWEEFYTKWYGNYKYGRRRNNAFSIPEWFSFEHWISIAWAMQNFKSFYLLVIVYDLYSLEFIC